MMTTAVDTIFTLSNQYQTQFLYTLRSFFRFIFLVSVGLANLTCKQTKRSELYTDLKFVATVATGGGVKFLSPV